MKTVSLYLVYAILVLAATKEAKVKLPNSRADLAGGDELFEKPWPLCHGPKGEGGRGPMLTRAKLSRAPDDATLLKILEEGIRGTEMPGAGAMSDREIRQTAAYVRSLGKVVMKPVPGDRALGAEVYPGKGICAGCHAIHAEGGVEGPDLSGDRKSTRL